MSHQNNIDLLEAHQETCKYGKGTLGELCKHSKNEILSEAEKQFLVENPEPETEVTDTELALMNGARFEQI